MECRRRPIVVKGPRCSGTDQGLLLFTCDCRPGHSVRDDRFVMATKMNPSRFPSLFTEKGIGSTFLALIRQFASH